MKSWVLNKQTRGHKKSAGQQQQQQQQAQKSH